MIITMAVSLTMLGASVLLYMQVDEMKRLLLRARSRSRSSSRPRRHRRSSATPSRPRSTATRWCQSSIYETQGAGVRAVQGALRGLARPGRVGRARTALPESFRVKLKDPEQYEEFTDQIQGPAGHRRHRRPAAAAREGLRHPRLDPDAGPDRRDRAWASRRCCWSVNTIQVAAYSKRREVAVMKLVGASNWFIQAPFVLEAVVGRPDRLDPRLRHAGRRPRSVSARRLACRR